MNKINLLTVFLGLMIILVFFSIAYAVWNTSGASFEKENSLKLEKAIEALPKEDFTFEYNPMIRRPETILMERVEGGSIKFSWGKENILLTPTMKDGWTVEGDITIYRVGLILQEAAAAFKKRE